MIMVHTDVAENYYECLKSKHQTVEKYNKNPRASLHLLRQVWRAFYCLLSIIFYSQANFKLRTEFSAVIVTCYFVCDNNNNRISWIFIHFICIYCISVPHVLTLSSLIFASCTDRCVG